MIRSRKLTFAAVFAIAACQPPASDGNPASPASETPTESTPSAAASAAAPAAQETTDDTAGRVETLAGEWRVAGLDGQPIDKHYAIALSADSERIWWEPTCAGQGRDYAIDGHRFRDIPPADTGPREVCLIGFPDELPAIWRAVEAADRIERTPANGVKISGGGHSLLLFSQ